MKKYLQYYSHLPHFKDYFELQNYSDDFGHSLLWNQEVEKWLANIKSIDEGYYFKQRNRVKNQKQRDELLGEYKAIYFVRRILKLLIIKIDPNKGKQDFLFEDNKKVKWYAEVKSPSWQAEIFNDNNLLWDEKLARKKKPQFINAEARSVSVKEAVEHSVKHSLSKFNKERNNLLLICPNMFFMDTIRLSKLENHYKLKNIVKKLDKDQLISAICLLQTCF